MKRYHHHHPNFSFLSGGYTGRKNCYHTKSRSVSGTCMYQDELLGNVPQKQIQLTLDILTSLMENNHLSRSENLVPIFNREI